MLWHPSENILCIPIFFAILIWIDQLLTLKTTRLKIGTSWVSIFFHRYLRGFPRLWAQSMPLFWRNRWKDRKRWATPGVNTAAKQPGVAPGARSNPKDEIDENQRELRVARCFEFFKSTCTSTSFWWAPNKPDVISIFGYKKARNYL